jgi:hypothetical protein
MKQPNNVTPMNIGIYLSEEYRNIFVGYMKPMNI